VDQLLENLRNWIGNGLASPSINRVNLWDEIFPSSKEFFAPKFLVLMGYNVFLLRPVEEREKGWKQLLCSWYSGVWLSWNVNLWDGIVEEHQSLRQGLAARKDRQDSYFNWSVRPSPWSDWSSTLVSSFLIAYWGRSGGCTGWRQWWFWFHCSLTCLIVFTLTFGFEWLSVSSRYHLLEDRLEEVGDYCFENHLIDATAKVPFRKNFPMWTSGQRMYLYFFSKTYKNGVLLYCLLTVIT